VKALLKQAGSKPAILMAGDSLMEQAYSATKCELWRHGQKRLMENKYIRAKDATGDNFGAKEGTPMPLTALADGSRKGLLKPDAIHRPDALSIVYTTLYGAPLEAAQVENFKSGWQLTDIAMVNFGAHFDEGSYQKAVNDFLHLAPPANKLLVVVVSRSLLGKHLQYTTRL
jgi:hypothetical protein